MRKWEFIRCKIRDTRCGWNPLGLWTDLSTITVPVAVGSVEWWIYNTKFSSLARTQLSENTRVYLIDLNGGIDFVRKPEAWVETNRTRDQEEGEGYHTHVAKVQEYGGKSSHIQLGKIVPYSIQHHIDGTWTASKEGSPPPSVVFIAQLKVTEENWNLRTSDHKDYHDQK